MNIGKAMQKLNSALKASEEAIYEADFGVEAAVPLNDNICLCWMKGSGGHNKWGLYIQVGNECAVPLLESTANLRVQAAHRIEALVAKLHHKQLEQSKDVLEAADALEGFSGKLKVFLVDRANK